MKRLRAWARMPALRFLLIGALLLGADRLGATLWPQTERLTVSADDIARLRQDWQNDTGRAPSPAELRASLNTWLDDEILLHEALRLQLDRSDPVVRRRLLMNLRFVEPGTTLDDEALLRQARALGMTQRDTVVRRRLIEVMHQRMVGGLQIQEADIRRYVEAHPEQFAAAARLDVEQRFFSRDRRRDPRADARTCARTPGACTGDAFLMGQSFHGQSESDLSRLFGPATAQAIVPLPVGTWSPPLESPYGWHLFRVNARTLAAAADYAQVRQRAAYAALAEKEKEVVHAGIEALRASYRVVLPDGFAGAAP